MDRQPMTFEEALAQVTADDYHPDFKVAELMGVDELTADRRRLAFERKMELRRQEHYS